ncbi:MAG: hypothetical protein AAF065_07035 [Verrucomicrobiota bacterium]
MSETEPEKYTAEEWNHIRKRFFHSILNETEVAKLGQNVGVSWPFKGSDETPAKYIEYEFEELESVPGLVGKMSRIKALMDILRETLAFDDPFGDMVDTVETESREDDTFERILTRIQVPTNYPADFIHFSEETKDLLTKEGVETLIECVHFGQKIARNAVIGGDLKSFLNSLSHKDEVGIARHIPYRRGERGLHLAEAIGLISEDMTEVAQLHLMSKGGVTLSDEETLKLNSSSELQIEASVKKALDQVADIGEWFSTEAADLETVFGTGGSPERYFIMINEPRRERIAVQLAKLQFAPEEEKKSGFLGRLFGR